jgi:lysophospholipase L1-like esterase
MNAPHPTRRPRLWFTLGLACTCMLLNGMAMASEGDSPDWPNLQAYRQKNAVLKSQGQVRHRVVFMGDSITEFWDQEGQKLFADKSCVNRGISGQTTPQMVLRFRQDVIDLQPEAVVILAGTNDIAGNTGPASTAMITDNIATMAELASLHHIKVVLASVLPAARYPWAPQVEPVARIAELNQWLSKYAAEHGYAYLDFFAAMTDGRGGLKPGYSEDGVHPNAAGYEVMTGLVRTTLATVLKTD